MAKSENADFERVEPCLTLDISIENICDTLQSEKVKLEGNPRVLTKTGLPTTSLKHRYWPLETLKITKQKVR